MSNNTTAVTGTASADPFDDPVTSNKMAIRALIPLLITFVLGTLCLQGFNLVFQQVGATRRTEPGVPDHRISEHRARHRVLHLRFPGRFRLPA